MIREVRELWSYRELLVTMVQRDMRVRYKNSILGVFWSFLNPLVTTAVLTFVFSRLLNNHVRNYSAYILAAYIPFNFFQLSLMDASQSVLQAIPIVKKIYFPREILPLSAVISNFIHMLLGFVVFFLYLLAIYVRDPAVSPFRSTMVYLPILLIISLVMATGLALIVAALNTFLEDVKYILGVVTYLLFFLCPVMYFEEAVANSTYIKAHPILFKLYNANPMASLTTAYRKVLLAPQRVHLFDGGVANPLPMNWKWVAYCAVVSFLFLIFGFAFFNRLKWKFMERP